MQVSKVWPIYRLGQALVLTAVISGLVGTFFFNSVCTKVGPKDKVGQICYYVRYMIKNYWRNPLSFVSKKRGVAPVHNVAIEMATITNSMQQAESKEE